MGLKRGQDVKLAKSLVFFLILERRGGRDNVLGISPPCIGLQIELREQVYQARHGIFAHSSLALEVCTLETLHILLEQLSAFVLVVGGAEQSLALDHWSCRLPASIVLDFGVALEHGFEIGAELRKSLFRTLLVLRDHVLTIFFENSLSLSRILDSAMLGILDGCADGLFPGPVGLYAAAPQHLDKGSFSLLGSRVLGIVAGGYKEGMGVRIVPAMGMTGLSVVSVIALLLVASVSTMRGSGAGTGDVSNCGTGWMQRYGKRGQHTLG